MLKIATIGLAVLCGMGMGAAYADDVVVHPGPAVVDGAHDGDSKTVVHEHDSATGCESKTVHKEDGAGDSKTVQKSDC